MFKLTVNIVHGFTNLPGSFDTVIQAEKWMKINVGPCNFIFQENGLIESMQIDSGNHPIASLSVI
jgi:hypothetical protein